MNRRPGMETGPQPEWHKWEPPAEDAHVLTAIADASVCGRCGIAVDAHSPVWIILLIRWGMWGPFKMYKRHKVAACFFCAEKSRRRVDNYEWNKCACGSCGRDVFELFRRYTYPVIRYFCSNSCRNRIYGRRWRARHPQPQKQTTSACRTCGTEFTSGRADAVTCSPKCRQKAHRLSQSLRIEAKSGFSILTVKCDRGAHSAS
jgi:hypothetical protein